MLHRIKHLSLTERQINAYVARQENLGTPTNHGFNLISKDSNGFLHGPSIMPDGRVTNYRHGLIHGGFLEYGVYGGDGKSEYWIHGNEYTATEVHYMRKLGGYFQPSEGKPRISICGYILPKERSLCFTEEDLNGTDLERLMGIIPLLLHLSIHDNNLALSLSSSKSKEQINDIRNSIYESGISSFSELPTAYQEWFGVSETKQEDTTSIAGLLGAVALCAAAGVMKKSAKAKVEVSA